MALVNGSSGGAPTGTAGGDLGGTYPNPTVTSGAHLTAASAAIAALADPTTGKVVGSASSAAAAVFPPGFEIGYTAITSPISIASTTEASGTTIISPGALVFDGTPVIVQFFAPSVLCDIGSPGDLTIVSLFESSTQIGRLAVANTPSSTTTVRWPCAGFLRFTPSAASHTYTVTAFANSLTGTPQVLAGAGGTGAAVPAFVRFTKV